jgi:hypothetical protein
MDTDAKKLKAIRPKQIENFRKHLLLERIVGGKSGALNQILAEPLENGFLDRLL